MSNPGYVRSTDGDNLDDGSTWALANEDSAGAAADAVAGDRVWFSDVHAESYAADTVITWPGTLASPNELLCGDDSAEPPAVLASSATITTTGSSDFVLNGSFYIKGFTFNVGSAGSGAGLKMNAAEVSASQHYETCVFNIVNTNINSAILLGHSSSGSETKLIWTGCDVQFSAAPQTLLIQSGNFHWNGGTYLSDVDVTALFEFHANQRSRYGFIENVNFSLMTSGALVDLTGAHPGDALVFRNCTKHANVAYTTGTIQAPGIVVTFSNVDSGDTNYTFYTEDYAGSIQDETSVVRIDGASDGTTAQSIKMSSGVNANEFTSPLSLQPTDEIVIWNEVVGESITVALEIVHDSQGSGAGGNLTNAEFKIDVNFLGSAGTTQGESVSSGRANILANAVDLANSSKVWLTPGLVSPVKQYAEVSLQAEEIGYILVRPHVLAPSAEIYVDQRPLVT